MSDGAADDDDDTQSWSCFFCCLNFPCVLI